MALFDRSGRKKYPEARLPGSRPRWEMASDFDPMGSYTGVPADGEEPIQDADDL